MTEAKAFSSCAIEKATPRLGAVPTVGENIRYLRERAGFEDQGAFAMKLGVPQSTISRWETDAALPNPASLVRIAVAVKSTVDALLDPNLPHDDGRDLSDHTRTGQPTVEAEPDDTDVRQGYVPDAIPVIAEGEATPEGLLWTNTIVRHAVIEYIARPHDVDDPDAYGILVIGDSMQPAFRKGHRVVVSPNTPVEDGDEVYVQLQDGRRLIKVAFKTDAGWRLESVNQKYEPAEVKADDVVAIHAIVWAKRTKPGRRVIDEQTGKRIRS